MSVGFFCPACGDAEHLLERCSCGLRWSVQRRDFGHYAVRLDVVRAELLRERLARAVTRCLLNGERARHEAAPAAEYPVGLD